jgi:hypothetical protein
MGAPRAKLITCWTWRFKTKKVIMRFHHNLKNPPNLGETTTISFTTHHKFSPPKGLRQSICRFSTKITYKSESQKNYRLSDPTFCLQWEWSTGQSTFSHRVK